MAFYLTPRNVSNFTSKYDFDKFLFDRSVGDLCKNTIVKVSSKIEMSTVKTLMAITAGFWAKSSVIAVLTVFCVLISTTSLLAEEMDERTKEETFSGGKEATSIALDEWLGQFHQLHLIVEKMKDCFSLILALTVFHLFVNFPYITLVFANAILINRPPTIYFSFLWDILSNVAPLTIMLSIRLTTISTVCHQLRDKVTAFKCLVIFICGRN